MTSKEQIRTTRRKRKDMPRHCDIAKTRSVWQWAPCLPVPTFNRNCFDPSDHSGARPGASAPPNDSGGVLAQRWCQDTIEESDQVATEQTSLRAGFKMKKTQLMCSVLLRGHLSLLLLQTFFSPEEMANRGRSMNKARSVCCPATEEDAPLPVAPNVKTFAGLLLHRHRPCKKTDGDFSIGDMTATSGCANTPWDCHICLHWDGFGGQWIGIYQHPPTGHQ